ncbi:MAG TPA: SRPBCC family protein [Alphaproteobacteria bacterium]|nr:SRPBCC family protein [Alphaproteobacteria bacterium]
MVKFEQNVKISAPVDTVWEILKNPNTWPLWFTEIGQITNLTSVQTGGTFQYKSGADMAAGSIVHVDEERGVIKVMTQEKGVPATHSFDVDRRGGLFGIGGSGSQLTYTMEYDPPGGMLGDFVASGNPADLLKVKKTLERIKDLAEKQAGS